MLSNKKLGRLLLSEKYLYFNFWSLFLPCPTNKEPGYESSSIVAVIGTANALHEDSLNQKQRAGNGNPIQLSPRCQDDATKQN